LEMEVTFEQFNSNGGQGRVAEVFLRGSLLDRAVFSPGALHRETESFRLPALPGPYWGEVAIAPDGLEIDDRMYFAVPSRRRVVGVVGETYFVKTALSPEGGGGFKPEAIEEGGINRENLSRVDVLVTANVARFSPIEVDAISDFLAAGGSMLIFLGSRVDVGAYNRNLLPRLGDFRLEEVVGGGEGGFYTIDRLDMSHSIFGKFKPGTSPFSEAKFYSFIRVNPGSGRQLASFSDGSPALIGFGDRVALFASAAGADWNDFVHTSQFLPLLQEMLLNLSTQVGLSKSYLLGEEVMINAASGGEQLVLESSTGAVRHFPAALGQAGTHRIEAPQEPGIYFLRDESETLSVFAVNVDRTESDLTKVPIDQLTSKLRGLEVVQIASVDDVGESINMLRTGRDLSRILLWGAIVLVVFEVILASNLGQGFRRDADGDNLTDS
jgi:hypothetical protein